jgi:hypothetical protein
MTCGCYRRLIAFGAAAFLDPLSLMILLLMATPLSRPPLVAAPWQDVLLVATVFYRLMMDPAARSRWRRVMVVDAANYQALGA